MTRPLSRPRISIPVFASAAALTGASAQDFTTFAPTPPMGWNSWDCYGSSVVESEVRANADYMAANLKEFGWEYIIVDIRWYIGNPGDHWYNTSNPVVHLDANGRILPAPNRFPSADGGNGVNLGFKPLADYVHSLGLKFGVHMMRGIKQEAWNQNLPIAGSSFRTRDIVRNTWDSGQTDTGAAWLHDCYGMDKTDEAQAYYNSLFNLYAEWGVDYVKVDDMLRDYSHPNDSYYADEIEMIRAAIDQTGRPMVLSLSPGDAPLEHGAHTKQYANMWRITNDLWDDWSPLYVMFQRAYEWTPFRGDGTWPDNDMLPLGHLGIRAHVGGDRMSNLTHDEQRTLMTLWFMSRSPLMFGGDMPTNDAFTLSLMNNPEALAVNQASSNNRQVFRVNDKVAWAADAPDGGTYLGVFNLDDSSEGFAALLAQAGFLSGLITASTPGHATAINADVTGADRLFLLVDAGDGSGPDPDVFDYDWADWVNMQLSGPGVPTISLTDLTWTTATSGWQGPRVGLNCEGNGPLLINGTTYADGIGTHAQSIIEYPLPAGYTTLTGLAGLDDAGVGQPGATSSVRFAVAALTGLSAQSVDVNLADLGYAGDVDIRDLWNRVDMGTFQGVFSTELAPHASALYHINHCRFDLDGDGEADSTDVLLFIDDVQNCASN
ncbi:MAG: NPCBM/NEW2 domain-containing protein [Phycisphaeraceae bacterium]|nr:MAG: NPCBM/NEW2 domain-containing protein [Phycisphaeraceae bacterium]